MSPFRFLPIVAVGLLAGIAQAQSFMTFESGQVRPLAQSLDGTRLFVVNTPDNRLEIFDITPAGLTRAGSVPVGLEPVAVAARSNSEVWVLNHLSDSVSIVDVGSATPRVARTLLVGDEPRDIVFAGPGRDRAFITTAHRGQQRVSPDLAGVPGAGDPQLTTPGIGRADVWVFDVNALGTTLGGLPLSIVTLFGDTPRALAVSPDGATVYAAVFKSGNQTTVVPDGAVCDGFGLAAACVTSQGFPMPGGLPPPGTNLGGERAPETGLIVKFDSASGQWRDELGRDWSAAVRFNLPDEDVFAIDATALTQSAAFRGVGTTLFNMAVNPTNGALYVSNTEARNEVRFEGPGVFGGTTVQGHLAESRITVIQGGTVLPRHLNKHIDYDVRPAPPGVKAHSLATPTGMAVSPDGNTLYVAAFGSSRIGVFLTAALAADSFDPTTASAQYLSVSGGGPSGLLLDAERQRLYVLTRFDNAVSVVNLTSRTETAHLALHNPEPPSVLVGRRFLYDAALTSSNGEASCSSCHIFGDMDDLAWDLGNPDDAVKKNPIPINLAIAITFGAVTLSSPINGTGRVDDFHPMKGPMTTQTFRGMMGSGAMHWRGDRATPPGTAASAADEVNSFNNFNVAFPGLVGRETELSPAEMQAFTDFALQIALPPNPIRRLNGALTPAQAAGRAFYFGPRRSDGLASDLGGLQVGFTCNGCHEVNPALGRFGTSELASFENEVQIFKIPHLRNLYQKVGMFGGIDVEFGDPLNTPFQGDQVRGFGFLHDGSMDTLFRFFNGTVFGPNGLGGSAVGFQNAQQRHDMEQFMMAFDTNLAPIVGQQVTLDATNLSVVGSRVELLLSRARAGECDLVLKGIQGGVSRGWVRAEDDSVLSDRSAEPSTTEPALRGLASVPGQELTYTCVPPGSGTRAGIDRDGDGALDRDEIDRGTDPADPNSRPRLVLIGARSLQVKDDVVPPLDFSKRKLTVSSKTEAAAAANRITLNVPGSAGDPTLGGARLRIYNGAGSTADDFAVELAAADWEVRSMGGRFVGYRYRGPVGAPISNIDVRADDLLIRGGQQAFGYSLDEPQQGSIAVRLSLGAELGWCLDAPARQKGNPPSTASNDRPGKFVGEPKTPAPASCPALPGSP